MVGFQRSVINTVDRLKFTINLGTVSSHIADEEQVDAAKVSISDAHFRTRIGAILPTKGDKWWELQPKSDLDKIADELLKILEEEALPYLHKIASDDALAALWAGKTAPGLTDAQRVRYLQIIRADKPRPKATG